jgi:tripartite-type tricarboxylate transporter receptor subunit TctC
VGLAAPNVKAGKLVALGTTGASRTGLLDVPTMKEQGYPGLEFTSWFGIVAPARTPADILARLNIDVVKAMQSADGKARLEDAGFRVTGTSREAFAKIIADDTQTWGKAVAATGFRAD